MEFSLNNATPFPAITAHRGDSSRFRENTITAIESAIENGADFVEIDIRQSKDGEVIVLHDRSLERLWGYPIDAFELTLLEIESLGFADYRIPTLKQIVNLFHDSSSRLLIDMDTADHALAAYKVVANSGISHSQIMWCGDLSAMKIIREQSAEAEIWLPWNETAMVDEALVAEIKPTFVNSHFSFWSADKVQKVHALGIKAAAWTIDDAPTMRWAAAIGIDSITTNQLDLIKKISKEDAFLDELDIKRITELALSIGQWAIMVCQMMSPGVIETKSNPADLVTEVDLFIETHAREMIQANFPTHNIVGEEFGGNCSETKPTWYIDPVDGTTNFANRTPWSSLSLSLAVGRDPLVGVTIDPWRNKLFHAIKGAGAFVNGERIIAPTFDESDSPLAGRVVLTELAGSEPWLGMSEFVDQLNQSFCTMRIMGAGTLTLTAVSANYGVGAVVHQFSPIDHLAAALIAHEAGCIVLNQKGEEELFPDVGGVMIVQPHARDALFEIWRSSFVQQ